MAGGRHPRHRRGRGGVRKLRRRRFLEDDYKGRLEGDLWTGLFLEGTSKERVKFATQKPVELIKRIIKSVTDEGDVVVDVFAGSGTTAHAAEDLGRFWAIADKSVETSGLTLKRLPKIAEEIIRTTAPPVRTDMGEDTGEHRYVYIIEDKTDPEWFKVGIAKNVEHRLSALRSGRRDRESIQAVHKVFTNRYRSLEKHIHAIFENRNEWVRASLGDLIEAFEAFLSSPSGSK